MQWKSENMNVDRVRYQSLVVIGSNGNVLPASESLVSETYVEFYHASIKAITGDDPNRPVETFVTDLMKRSQLCFDNLQEAKHKWAAENEIDLSKLSATEREHLSDARRQLDNQPYHWFEEQYKLSKQYNVLEAEQGGTKGAFVCHTSQDKSKGYFIPGHANYLSSSPGKKNCRWTKSFRQKYCWWASSLHWSFANCFLFTSWSG
jgi:hypothetical protein